MGSAKVIASENIAPRILLYQSYGQFFDECGLALTGEGRALSRLMLQEALNQYAQMLRGPISVRRFRFALAPTHLIGSFTKGRPRLGVFKPDISFETACAIFATKFIQKQVAKIYSGE